MDIAIAKDRPQDPTLRPKSLHWLPRPDESTNVASQVKPDQTIDGQDAFDRYSFSQGFFDREMLLSEIVSEVSANSIRNQKSVLSQVSIRNYKHGDSWSGIIHKEGGPQRSTGQFSLHAAKAELASADVMSFNLDALLNFPHELGKQQRQQMERTLFEAIEEAAADRPPIDFKPESDPRDLFRSMWTQIKIGVDKNLKLHTPCLAGPAEFLAKLEKAAEKIEKCHPEFADELKAIQRQKHIEALIAHIENLKKFKLNDATLRHLDNSLLGLRQLQQPTVHEE